MVLTQTLCRIRRGGLRPFSKRWKLLVAITLPFLFVGYRFEWELVAHRVSKIVNMYSNERLYNDLRALYINAPSREDRRRHIVRELRRARIRHERVNGVIIPLTSIALTQCSSKLELARCAGKMGCQLSHLLALKRAIRRRWDHVAIFEDDFAWAQDFDPFNVRHAIRTIQKQFPEWDVILISANIVRHAVESGKDSSIVVVKLGKLKRVVVRVREAYATHGYLVRRTYLDRVRGAFENCNVSDFSQAIDVCWKPLQSDHGNWYGMIPQLGRQYASYSDIEQRMVSYELTA